MVTISKAINGISINGNETLLNEDGSVMEFKDKEEAISFLRDHGFDLTDEEFEDDFTFTTYSVEGQCEG